MSTTIEPIAEQRIQSWQLDPAHTNIEFAVKHLMISTVKGRFGDVNGVLKGDLSQPDGFELDVTIGTESVDTRQAQRDAHLRSPDFFDAAQWPSIRFVGRRIEGDVNGEFALYGDITIRDVTRELRLEVTNEGSARDPWGGSRLGFSAKGKLDRRDFGLLYNQALETGGFVVGDEIRIAVDAEFIAAAATSVADAA